MSCPSKNHLVAYINYQLSESEDKSIKSHIKECEACKKQLDTLIALDEILCDIEENDYPSYMPKSNPIEDKLRKLEFDSMISKSLNADRKKKSKETTSKLSRQEMMVLDSLANKGKSKPVRKVEDLLIEKDPDIKIGKDRILSALKKKETNDFKGSAKPKPAEEKKRSRNKRLDQ